MAKGTKHGNSREGPTLTASEARLRKLERLASGQAQALSRRINALTAEPYSFKLVEQTLKAATEELGGSAGVLWAYEPGGGETQLYLEYQSEGTDGAGSLLDGSGALRRLAEHPGWRSTGEKTPSVVLTDSHSDRRLDAVREELFGRGIRSLLIVPLWLNDERFGYLVVSSVSLDDGDLALA